MPRLLASTALALFAFGAFTAASAIEVTQTVTTTAAPDKVWGVIGDFAGISTWLPPAASSPADNGNKIGSVRVLTLKAPGDPTVTEKLTGRNAKAHSYTYQIVKVDPKVLPVTNYSSKISVTSAAGGSTVTWHGTFKAAGGADDATASKAITGVYRAGLDNIKVLSEK